MRLWSKVRSWVRALLRRSRIESEMDAELRFHIEAFAEDLARNGVPREEAMRRARVEFGGIERAKEECREARGVNFLETVVQDVRYGLRMLRKNPAFTAVPGAGNWCEHSGIQRGPHLTDSAVSVRASRATADRF